MLQCYGLAHLPTAEKPRLSTGTVRIGRINRPRSRNHPSSQDIQRKTCMPRLNAIYVSSHFQCKMDFRLLLQKSSEAISKLDQTEGENKRAVDTRFRILWAYSGRGYMSDHHCLTGNPSSYSQQCTVVYPGQILVH